MVDLYKYHSAIQTWWHHIDRFHSLWRRHDVILILIWLNDAIFVLYKRGLWRHVCDIPHDVMIIFSWRHTYKVGRSWRQASRFRRELVEMSCRSVMGLCLQELWEVQYATRSQQPRRLPFPPLEMERDDMFIVRDIFIIGNLYVTTPFCTTKHDEKCNAIMPAEKIQQLKLLL